MNRSIVGQILNYFKKKKVKRKKKKVIKKQKRIAKRKQKQVIKVKKIKVMSRRKKRRLKRKTRRAKRKTGRKRIVIGGLKVKKRRVDRWKKKGKLVKKLKKVKKRRKTIVSVIIAPLLPLRKAMKRKLEGKGISTKKMKFVDIVTKFYNEFVSKKNPSKYEPISDSFLSDHYLNATGNYDEESDHLAGTTIGVIVTSVVSFFKKIKDKKARGEKLLPSEEETLTDLKEVEDKLKTKEENELPVKQKQIKNIIMYVLIVVVVGVIIYMAKNR